ncbi:MAG TPA: aminoglycoside phosphotransferase family protein [Pseudonocardiaceae bacterium]|jgi:aminoglycoside phosphotransferase (APT) family kinase protein
MHADEVDIDADLVRGLVAARFPHWADLPITPVASAGTDNAMFRLGPDLAVRLPRIPGAAADVEAEQRWLPKLAPHLPVAIPVVVGAGEPTGDYPWRWSVCRWLTGCNPQVDALDEPEDLAIDIAEFIAALRAVNPAGGPVLSRSGRLARRDEATRAAIDASRGLVDIDALHGIWAETVTIAGSAPHAWAHGDLSPGNVLIDQGRLRAVIDFGAFGVGDPTVDLIVAWNLLPAAARPILRAALDVDDATWARGRGWALSIAVIQLPYYRDTNPALAANSRHVLEQIIADQRTVGRANVRPLG